MLFGLQDLSPDLYFEVDDTKIDLYLRDIIHMPELTNILPMGSFGEDEMIKLVDLPYEDRINVGRKYLARDDYAVKKFGICYIKRDIFLQEFSTIPKLVQILEDTETNESLIPMTSFAQEDLYYLIILYFSSMYRDPNPQEQLSKQYSILTDADMELNKFVMITKVSTFFFYSFKNYLGTTKGQMPFQCEMGTKLKHVIQSKNTLVQQVQVENEINFFIDAFNELYSNLIEVSEIVIENNRAPDGGDSWVVNVNAYIENEFIGFKIIV